MDCSVFHDLMSARLDGQVTDPERRLLDAHLQNCAECARVDGELATLHRTSRLRAAEPVPDLTEAILARAQVPRMGRNGWIRLSLAWVGVIGIAQALPELLGHDTGASVHVARHLGSLTLAMFIGLLYAAWRPQRAFGLLPIAGALAGSLVISSVVDVTSGVASVMGESGHLLEVAGLLLLWALAGSPRPRLAALRDWLTAGA